MGKKLDIKRLEAVAREFQMTAIERREFGDYVEERKRSGELGSGQDGDYTYAELREKAVEFREEKG